MRVQPSPVITLGLAVVHVVILAVATSYLGWWGPAIHEEMRAPAWLWAVPVLMVLPGLGSLRGGSVRRTTSRAAVAAA